MRTLRLGRVGGQALDCRKVLRRARLLGLVAGAGWLVVPVSVLGADRRVKGFCVIITIVFGLGRGLWCRSGISSIIVFGVCFVETVIIYDIVVFIITGGQ